MSTRADGHYVLACGGYRAWRMVGTGAREEQALGKQVAGGQGYFEESSIPPNLQVSEEEYCSCQYVLLL